MKTKPVSLRFDQDDLTLAKEKSGIKATQKLMDFILSEYVLECKRKPPSFSAPSKIEKKSEASAPSPTPSVKKSIPQKEIVPFPGDRPRNLDELKALCPKELTGFERSSWISIERQKYNI